MPEAPLASMVTLGVKDFADERNFYRNLGLSLAFDSDDFAVFELRGAMLALFLVEKLAADARTEPNLSRGGIRSSVIINVDQPAEVDEWAERSRRAGATITKEPVDAEFFTGRDAYFAVPEGNYWEVARAPRDNPVVGLVHRAAGLNA